jgi:hypothetical membrane protein
MLLAQAMIFLFLAAYCPFVIKRYFSAPAFGIVLAADILFALLNLSGLIVTLCCLYPNGGNPLEGWYFYIVIAFVLSGIASLLLSLFDILADRKKWSF